MKRILLIIISLFFVAGLSAQSTGDIRINEVLVKNIDNYMDDYGHRSSWVELHNTGYSKIDIGDCYLVVHKKDGESISYRIPAGDPATVMGPLGYSIFYCEGTGTKGTFYTNFTLENIAALELLNASGKGEAIDRLEIDYDEQIPDVSVGYMRQEGGGVNFISLPQTTPNATNDTEPIMPRSEQFQQLDPSGGMMAMIAVTVVLVVLAVLFLCFKMLGMYNVWLSRKKVAAVKPESVVDKKTKPYPHSGEEVAAIVMALNAYRELIHDQESNLITITKVARAYSPWSSKIYGLRETPIRNRKK